VSSSQLNNQQRKDFQMSESIIRETIDVLRSVVDELLQQAVAIVEYRPNDYSAPVYPIQQAEGLAGSIRQLTEISRRVTRPESVPAEWFVELRLELGSIGDQAAKIASRRRGDSEIARSRIAIDELVDQLRTHLRLLDEYLEPPVAQAEPPGEAA
jgi:hypothetical protein